MNKGTCKHYNGAFHNKTCAAGIDYESVTSEPERQLGKGLRIPCHRVCIFRGASQIEEHSKRGSCASYEEPTDAEIAAHEKEIDRVVGKHMKATAIISKVKKEHAGVSWKGVEVCPVCSGKLHMSHAAYNGHVHGQCETKGCLNWME